MTPDPATLRDRAIAAGLDAAALIRRFGRDGLDVQQKRAFDFVTAADLASQALLIDRLAVDGVAVLAEEGEPAGEPAGGHRWPRWVIDPLDGTNNFVHGIPQVAVSLALQTDARTTAVAVVVDVHRAEVFHAVRGGGAFLRTHDGDERRLCVSTTARLDAALVGTGFPTGPRRAEVDVAVIGRLLAEVQCVRRMGAAALDLAWLAAGRLEAFFELGLAPWDTAAGLLLVEEAGGVVTDEAGGAFVPGMPWVVASNGRLHAEILRMLRGSA